MTTELADVQNCEAVSRQSDRGFVVIRQSGETA